MAARTASPREMLSHFRFVLIADSIAGELSSSHHATEAPRGLCEKTLSTSCGTKQTSSAPEARGQGW